MSPGIRNINVYFSVGCNTVFHFLKKMVLPAFAFLFLVFYSQNCNAQSRFNNNRPLISFFVAPDNNNEKNKTPKFYKKRISSIPKLPARLNSNGNDEELRTSFNRAKEILPASSGDVIIFKRNFSDC